MSEPLDPSACCRCHVLPDPEPDYGPRPAGCCGICPPILGGGYDCTCADNPRCDANKADRYDCDGEPWRWCDECDGFRMGARHKPGIGWNAVEIDERYGPLTFAPRPTDTPTTAPQPWTAIYTGEEVISSGGFSAWLEAHDREVVSRTLLETADEHLAKAEGFRNLIPRYFRGPGVNGAYALNNQIADGFDLSAHWLKYKAERINNV